VKHLLIILSILLLSSPLFGQETGVLYLYESSSGFVLKSFGDGKVQPKYKGEITNGEPNGFGVLIYPYNKKSVVGEWKEGKEWNTKHTKKDGTPIGKFKNGKWISGGVLFFGYRNGKKGWYSEKWEGKFYRNENSDLGEYLGEIINELPNGQGTFTKYDFTQGKYVGKWKDGKKNGQGTYTYLEIGKMVGQWKDDKKVGKGTQTFPNGNMFVGEWKIDKRWNGIVYDKNGNIYYKYVNGEIKTPNGGKFDGQWENGIMWNGIVKDKNGIFDYKIVNGERIKP